MASWLVCCCGFNNYVHILLLMTITVCMQILFFFCTYTICTNILHNIICTLAPIILVWRGVCVAFTDETTTVTSPCLDGFFRCTDGACIAADLVCDGHAHCSDQSDEGAMADCTTGGLHRHFDLWFYNLFFSFWFCFFWFYFTWYIKHHWFSSHTNVFKSLNLVFGSTCPCNSYNQYIVCCMYMCMYSNQ